jgi:TrmH family RNA methyltransferase
MTRIDRVASPSNPLLKEVRRAAGRGDPTTDGLWIAEGFHLLEEAVRSELEIPVVLMSETVAGTTAAKIEKIAAQRIVSLPKTLFESIATTEATQGLIALVRPPQWQLPGLFAGHSLVLILDGIQDPGNAGAAVRSAEAFGATGVIFMKGSVGPWNPKALRASAGSSFRVPLVTGMEPKSLWSALKEYRVDAWAAMPWETGSTAASKADFTERIALVVGSEGGGISDALLSISRGVSIPTTGVESLNAATAAAILLYEAQRQRPSKPANSRPAERAANPAGYRAAKPDAGAAKPDSLRAATVRERS